MCHLFAVFFLPFAFTVTWIKIRFAHFKSKISCFIYSVSSNNAHIPFKYKCLLRYILEARKRALAKKKKLRTLGRRARSRDSDEDQEEEDGNIWN